MQINKFTVTFFIIFWLKWSDLLPVANWIVCFIVGQRLTYTWYQDPGARRTGGSSDGLSQSFCSVDATGEQIVFVAFIPPETTQKSVCQCTQRCWAPRKTSTPDQKSLSIHHSPSEWVQHILSSQVHSTLTRWEAIRLQLALKQKKKRKFPQHAKLPFLLD